MNRIFRLLAWVAALCILPELTPAQWMTQSVDLKPGWNSVFLNVDAGETSTTAIMAGLPVDAVWAWAGHFNPSELPTAPGALSTSGGDWIAWFPPGTTQDALTDLRTMDGGHGYLIKASATATLSVKGKPHVFPLKYLPGTLNLVGYTVSASAAPSFQSFFAPSSAHAGQAIFRLNNATGNYEAANPTSSMINGEAFWIFTSGASEYQGPFEVLPPYSGGATVGTTVNFSTRSSAPSGVHNLAFQMLASEAAPVGDSPLVAGDVPLSHFLVSAATSTVAYVPFAAPFTVPVTAGVPIRTNFSVRRTAMAPFTTPPGKKSLYQSIMKITDGSGYEKLIPVSAVGIGGEASAGLKLLSRKSEKGAGSTIVQLKPGLWVGNATVDGVNQPALNNVSQGVDEPAPVGSKASFRLIIHVADNGDMKLLQKVYFLFKQGVETTDSDGRTVIVTPGHNVLVTDETLLPIPGAAGQTFQGGALVDGKLVPQRLSSAVFSFKDPQPLADISTGADGSLWGVSLSIPYDDPLNPFVHRYHPDHDNMNETFDATLPSTARESYNITRDLSFSFAATDPEGLPRAGYGDTEIAGEFDDDISGIHRSTMKVHGTFRLSNISQIGVLNDGI
ncbi:hypothetical protein BH09SUM1_BH09SUM1_20570 [soil metagenome]